MHKIFGVRDEDNDDDDDACDDRKHFMVYYFLLLPACRIASCVYMHIAPEFAFCHGLGFLCVRVCALGIWACLRIYICCISEDMLKLLAGSAIVRSGVALVVECDWNASRRLAAELPASAPAQPNTIL